MGKWNELINRLRELFEDFYVYAFGPIVFGCLIVALVYMATHP
jgi:hypothetical protein